MQPSDLGIELSDVITKWVSPVKDAISRSSSTENDKQHGSNMGGFKEVFFNILYLCSL